MAYQVAKKSVVDSLDIVPGQQKYESTFAWPKAAVRQQIALCQKENLQVADMNFNSKLVVDETNEKVLTRWKKIFTTDDCFNELILVTELGEIMKSKKNWREILINQTYVKLKNSLVVIAFNQYRICDIDSWVLNKDQLIGEGEQASDCPFRPRAIR